ncbi:MAG: sugar phosphate isomerase/epimerase [Clostridiales bacterium]|nr:sugar phosphate isomerase/epimerase [Clostridiales bacterium]
MEIGLFTNCFHDKPWEEICRIANENGISIVEAGAGALNGKSHCNPAELLKDAEALKKFRNTAKRYNIEIRELSCMGNYLHPNKNIADGLLADLEAAMELASKLGITIINTFAGCPGAGEGALYPNWIALTYPPEFAEYSKWQWEKKIIPFWNNMVRKARMKGIRFGFEMHTGDSVYNPETLLRLREETGAEEISCKFDPTHLFWQGIDPIICIKKLGSAIISVHAQDAEINKQVMECNGCFTTRDYSDVKNRPWNLRLVGYGHPEAFWRDMISALRREGYDGSINIEHQDACISLNEGINKASDFLKKIIFHQKSVVIKY